MPAVRPATRSSLAILLPATLALHTLPLSADGLSFEGFFPLVGLGLTDEFKFGDGLDPTFFLADPATGVGGSSLPTGGPAYYDLALLDTGAATHILTAQAAGPGGFDIEGSGFGGTNVQPVGGATGTLDLSINDPHGIYVAGLADRLSDASPLAINASALRGQTSTATLSAPGEWSLPNIVGLPMIAQHAIHIRNSSPQMFAFDGQTVRTPQIDLLDLGSGGGQGIQRRAPLILNPGLGFVQGPLYVQNIDLFTFVLHDNPLSPTVVESGALFVEVDLANNRDRLEDRAFFFDTGASLTVLSEQTAVRLGFDPVLHPPDFVLAVEGSAGTETGVPGFYLQHLSIDTIGGSFELAEVPVAVLDVANPGDPGNVVDGIIGMNLFVGRDLVIDSNPAAGQGGTGPSLYISDPVWTTHQWASAAASEDWQSPANWSTPGPPGLRWQASLGSTTANDQEAVVSADSTVFRTVVSGTTGATMTVRINPGATLSTFADLELRTGGRALLDGGRIDAQYVQLNGGTLAGTGTVVTGSGPMDGSVRTLDGCISPGQTDGSAIGSLTIDGGLAIGPAGSLCLDLGGTSPGVTHDQLVVRGNAFLGGTLELARLDPGGGLFDPPVGTTLTVLTASEMVGEFAGLPDGATIFASGAAFRIAYASSAVTLERIQFQPDLVGEVELLSSDEIELRFTGLPGRNYRVEFTETLAPPAIWAPVGTFAADPSGIVSITRLVQSRRQFFRAAQEQ